MTATMHPAPAAPTSCSVEIDMAEPSFDELVVAYVRQKCTRVEEHLASPLRWRIGLARGPREVEVEVVGQTATGRECRAEGRDRDAMIAVRNAFAVFQDRLEA